MQDPENIEELVALQPDYIGLIFYEGSKRYAGATPSMAIEAVIPDSIEPVGVFVNEAMEEIEEISADYNINTLQLHGDESPEFCGKLKNKGFKVIKAFGVDEQFDFKKLEPYKNKVDFFLFDTKGKERGGNGVTFDWSILKKYDNSVPFFLSGGLSADNISEVLKLEGMNMHAVDVNSKFELEPGVKDVELLKESVFKKLRI